MTCALAILGGGPAGLAAGCAAASLNVPFAVFEGAPYAGGNCRTISRDGFRFDTGAHRLHDRDAGVTAWVRSLLDGELNEVAAPSRIAFDGRFVNFPLSPINAARALGARRSARALIEIANQRLHPRTPAASFEDFALKSYGRTLAEAFLLGYSSKLWGRPCRELAPEIAGARLNGLGVRAVLAEMAGGGRRTRHLDGRFLYPRRGIGRLTDRLAQACGEALRLRSRITRVLHDGRRIAAVVVNDRERVGVEAAVSTLPLGAFASMLDPAPPPAVLDAAEGLRFRHVVLVAIFLRRRSVTPCATVYFPDPAVPFTRVYEPRNRSEAMAPAGHTSLVVEIPCGEADGPWRMDDLAVAALARGALEGIGWVDPVEIAGIDVHRLADAYPVLDVDARGRALAVEQFLGRFANLRLAGRPGRFAYSHLHDQLRQGRESVAAILGGTNP
ncbi:MAG: FAD-dependent oxidoreductase [Acidobacteria bacterium]|nr:FAD-dependent oxidoreductase [Acidobacteriota bacterium]